MSVGGILETGNHMGYEWMIRHNGLGFRCGYVQIPSGHPWFKKHYHNIDVDVHGGLTFSDWLDGNYWIGFDCAHYNDAQDPDLPTEYESEHFFKSGVIRSQKYVREQCILLCDQALNAQLFNV